MAPQQADESRRKTKGTNKLPKLPSSAKVTKRPLMRPAIASPHTGSDTEKVVYVSHKMPFMAGIHRVQSLLKQVDKRAIQSVLDARRSKRLAASEPRKDPSEEPVIIKATGRAIGKALEMANHLRKQPNLTIRLATSSVDAIDDIEIPDDAQAAEADDIPEARVRTVSVMEIRVTQI